jgi:hypothetical protein
MQYHIHHPPPIQRDLQREHRAFDTSTCLLCRVAFLWQPACRTRVPAAAEKEIYAYQGISILNDQYARLIYPLLWLFLPLSMISIDDLERIIDYVPIGSRFSNAVL